MSKKADQVQQDQLINRWLATHAPSIGVTCTASSGPPESGGGRLYLDSILWSVNNGKGAAAATFTASIRDASIGGTVLESWEVVVAAGAGLIDDYYTVVPGIVGNALVFEFGTPQTSVTQRATIGGWQEDFR
jgi:hypothetical protein